MKRFKYIDTKYIDTVKTKKGKVRTWLGHLRALARVTGIPVRKLKERIGN